MKRLQCGNRPKMCLEYLPIIKRMLYFMVIIPNSLIHPHTEWLNRINKYPNIYCKYIWCCVRFVNNNITKLLTISGNKDKAYI